MTSDLPILIASVTEDLARAIEEAAGAGGTLDVPLKWPPAEPGTHVLEVYLPSSNEPLTYLAEAAGEPGDAAVPLRIWRASRPPERISEGSLPLVPVSAPDLGAGGDDIEADVEAEMLRTQIGRETDPRKVAELLVPVAARILAEAEHEPSRASVELLAAAEAAGAHALYSARVNVDATGHARVAFVTTMKVIGTGASPVLAAALERLLQPLAAAHPAVPELVEDLLLGIPAAPDEALGALAAGYASAPPATVRRAAARALARAWGPRAEPALRARVEDVTEDDAVVTAALVGLREIGAVGRAVAVAIEALFAARPRSSQLRVAAEQALASSTEDARAEAERVRAALPA